MFELPVIRFGVYVLFDFYGAPIYVGKSIRTNIFGRINSGIKAAGSLITDVRIYECNTAEEAGGLERKLIRNYQPPMNRQLKHERKKPYIPNGRPRGGSRIFTVAEEDVIVEAFSAGISEKEIADTLGLGPQTISRIIARRAH